MPRSERTSHEAQTSSGDSHDACMPSGERMSHEAQTSSGDSHGACLAMGERRTPEAGTSEGVYTHNNEVTISAQECTKEVTTSMSTSKNDPIEMHGIGIDRGVAIE